MPENLLGREKSPYLLQHKNNPVHWYPWGEDAFNAARLNNKPIFLSIGYSTCYWCHVMEKESFENQEIAKLLNDNYVAIKVDREERPDIDQLYMGYVEAFTGRGGWPMSVFLDTQLRPFWGGTFFYKKDFASILQVLASAWNNQKEEVSAAARDAENSWQELSRSTDMEPPRDNYGAQLERFLLEMEAIYDGVNGGFGGAPKFPPAMQCMLLLRIERLLHDEERRKSCRKMVLFTLERMARGGIFDQIGFGFHRYSTDESWLVPHFEKMLYDNALLISAYLEAYLVSGNPFFARVAENTITFLNRDMLSPERAFYSALDAGKVGREGEFYLWSWDELVKELSPEELELAGNALGCSKEGNFEGSSCVLTGNTSSASLEEGGRLSRLKEKLYVIRKRRTRPRLDHKIITSWNALAISALAKAYQILGDKGHLKTAAGCMSFIREWLFDGQYLRRHYALGTASTHGFLDDYAYLIAACLDLWESDFSEEWLAFALKLQRIQDELLLDKESGAYFYSEKNELPARRKDTFDNAVPSGNSVASINLLRLNALFPDQGFDAKAKQILESRGIKLLRYPLAFPMLLQAVYLSRKGATEISIVGAGGRLQDQALRLIYSKFIPERSLMLRIEGEEKPLPTRSLNDKAVNGRTTIYVCRGHTCSPPITDLEMLGSLLRDNPPAPI